MNYDCGKGDVKSYVCRKLHAAVVLSALLLGGGVVQAEISEKLLKSMPVKEVTVFKDGHAFVRHEGTVATDTSGDIVLDYLPRPVVGTFWAYSRDKRAELKAVKAGRRAISVGRTALSVAELIEGNVGRKVRIKETGGEQVYEARILKVPVRTSEEVERTSADSAHQPAAVRGQVVMLEVAEGVRVVPMAQIEKVTFLEEVQEKVSSEEYRNVMTLKLDWGRNRRGDSAEVGMVYLQRGIRWIPSYYVDIDGEGRAKVKLQATIINELADMEDVTTHLVIGVPAFAFKETVDPISLQQTIAQLSSHFEQNRRNAYAYSNMIMSQSAAYMPQNEPGGSGGDTIDLGPELKSGQKNEDLYVFTVEHLTLKKGERMVMPVVEFELAYTDVYTVNLPFGPPPEARQNYNNEQQAELARLLQRPRAEHNIRLVNDTEYPITTAPALILRNGHLIAQGMTKYTAVGAKGDLELTTAVDISVKKADKESGRTPNAANWGGYNYSKCDLGGEITLTNHKTKAVRIEVRRFVLGNIDSASSDGVIDHLGWHEGGWLAAGEMPVWWNWYNWPYWWHHFNPVGRIQWDVELDPGESVELEYAWHYFWRN